MPDAIFADPRLAAVYDAFDGERTDLTAYLGLARALGAQDVLDVGCGTGALAVRLAAAGCSVTAVDPAEASLAVARGKVGAEHVRWVHGEVGDVLGQFDLVVMTGNVAQVFLTDADWDHALQGLRAVLRTDGWFVLETRRPEARAWEDWARDTGPVRCEVPGVGLVEQRREVTRVALPVVSFRQTYAFPDDTVVGSDSTLRFRSEAELRASLETCGLAVQEVREAPDRPGRELVVLARLLSP